MTKEIKPTLARIEHEKHQRLKELAEKEGVVNDQEWQEIYQLCLASKDKVFSTCRSLDYFDAEIDYIKKEIALANEYLAKKNKEKQRRLKCLEFIMNSVGKTKLEGDMGRNIILRKSKAVKVDISIDQLPKEFVRNPEPKPEADKRAIKQAIESGQTVEGCYLVETRTVDY